MPISNLPDVNPFTTRATSLDAPARRMTGITPNDAADLPVYAKALRVFNGSEETAQVTVTPAGEANDAHSVTLKFPWGLSVEPCMVRRVWAAGTTPGLTLHGYLD